mgnify:FL=1
MIGVQYPFSEANGAKSVVDLPIIINNDHLAVAHEEIYLFYRVIMIPPHPIQIIIINV